MIAHAGRTEGVDITNRWVGDPPQPAGRSDDTHSRYIEAAVGSLIVGCLYLPNGNPAPGPKFDYKLHLFERLTGYSQSLLDSGAPAPISRGNRKFESISLQQGVTCEPDVNYRPPGADGHRGRHCPAGFRSRRPTVLFAGESPFDQAERSGDYRYSRNAAHSAVSSALRNRDLSCLVNGAGPRVFSPSSLKCRAM